jgi:hypothetical protein
MASYYFYGDDGVLREFDENKNFIPNENVAAFVAGEAFDWGRLQSYSGSGGSGGGAGRAGASSAAKSTALQRRHLRETLDESIAAREAEYAQQRTEIESESLDAARRAYIDSRVARRDSAANLAAAGLRGGEQEEQLARLERAYRDAVRSIALQRAQRLAAAQKKRDSGVAGDEAAYRRAVERL